MDNSPITANRPAAQVASAPAENGAWSVANNHLVLTLWNGAQQQHRYEMQGGKMFLDGTLWEQIR